jgi:hypothetical protein
LGILILSDGLVERDSVAACKAIVCGSRGNFSWLLFSSPQRLKKSNSSKKRRCEEYQVDHLAQEASAHMRANLEGDSSLWAHCLVGRASGILGLASTGSTWVGKPPNLGRKIYHVIYCLPLGLQLPSTSIYLQYLVLVVLLFCLCSSSSCACVA